MCITISLCMIVKNEEHNLPHCLNSVKDLVDEINIIDTGSTDNTVEIAKAYTDRIFHFDWIDDFSAARNFSFSKATKEYIFWLDADDVIYEEDRKKFMEMKRTLNPEADVVYMDYIYRKDKNGNPLIVQSRERLLRRSKGYLWKNKIHESLEVKGFFTSFDIAINHDHFDAKKSYERNKKMVEDAINSGNPSVRDLYYHIRHMAKEGNYDEALKYYPEFERLNKSEYIPAVDLYTNVHEIYLTKKDYEKAYLVLAQNEEILQEKAEFYCALGDFAKNILLDIPMAIKYYEKATKCPSEGRYGIKYQNNMSYYYFTPLYEIGMCYLQLHEYNKAKEAFENALKYKLDPDVEGLVKKINQLLEKE